jgi:hypothetical protein
MKDKQDPKGMVRTEMGRLVKKSDQDAWEKGITKSMNEEYFGRGKAAVDKKPKGKMLKAMKTVKKPVEKKEGGEMMFKAKYSM